MLHIIIPTHMEKKKVIYYVLFMETVIFLIVMEKDKTILFGIGKLALLSTYSTFVYTYLHIHYWRT